MQEVTPGFGNISSDPLYINPLGHDLSLSVGSPAFNIADVASVPAYIVEDIIYNPRNFGGVDMGAYEMQLPVRRAKDEIGQFSANIYPNPSGGLFNVEMLGGSGSIEWMMYDMQGSLIKNGISDSLHFQIDARDVLNSPYLILLRSDNDTIMKKITKIRT